MIIERLEGFVRGLVRVDTEPYEIALEKHPLRVGPLKQKFRDLMSQTGGAGDTVEEMMARGRVVSEVGRNRIGEIRQARKLVILNARQIPLPPKYSPLSR